MENRWDVPRSLICTPNNFSITRRPVELFKASKRAPSSGRPAGDGQTRHTSLLGQDSERARRKHPCLWRAVTSWMQVRCLPPSQKSVRSQNAWGWHKKNGSAHFCAPFYIDWQRASKELRGTTLDYWVFIHDAAPVRGAFVRLSAGKLCFSVKRWKTFCLREGWVDWKLSRRLFSSHAQTWE